MEGGRKYTGMLIAFGLICIGFLATHFLKIKSELFAAYSKYIIYGLSVFVGGNSLITGAALLSNNTEEKK